MDTDIFVIAALHPEAPCFAVNGRFVELMRSRRGAFATTIFNKLEMVRLYRRMKLGDALVLMVAESHPQVDTFVTWNAKHFRDKTHLFVLTPSEFLRRKT